ncbi:unnamed protein product [Prunus armeniaca]
MKAWVALTYFQQLDESFVKLLGDLTEEKMGSNGRPSLEIEGKKRKMEEQSMKLKGPKGMLAFDEFSWLLGGLQQPR